MMMTGSKNSAMSSSNKNTLFLLKVDLDLHRLRGAPVSGNRSA